MRAANGMELRLTESSYEVLEHVHGCVGGERVHVGEPGRCRYCGTDDRRSFKSAAHTFPEALGNNWVFSLDECDDCNHRFGFYESALVSSVGPLLTLGGVKGKNNHVRQTGRSAGPIYVRHTRDPGGTRRISAFVDTGSAALPPLGMDPCTGESCLTLPVANERFRPRWAYKALNKIAYSLLPNEERPNYEQLRLWLLDLNDAVDFPVLEVAMSYAMVGNAPELVSGTLLRRKDPTSNVPHILFVMCAGSICLRIDLRSDHLEDHILCSEIGALTMNWTTCFPGPAGPEAHWTFRDQAFLNWSSSSNELGPIEAIRHFFDVQNNTMRLEPILRVSEMRLR